MSVVGLSLPLTMGRQQLEVLKFDGSETEPFMNRHPNYRRACVVIRNEAGNVIEVLWHGSVRLDLHGPPPVIINDNEHQPSSSFTPVSDSYSSTLLALENDGFGFCDYFCFYLLVALGRSHILLSFKLH